MGLQPPPEHTPLKTAELALWQVKKPADTGEAEVYPVPCFNPSLSSAFSKDVNGRCVSTLPTSYSRLQNEEKLWLCQDITERCSGLYTSGASSAEACVYPQT